MTENSSAGDFDAVDGDLIVAKTTDKVQTANFEMLFSKRSKFFINGFAGSEKKVFSRLELEKSFRWRRRFENEEDWTRNWNVL